MRRHAQISHMQRLFTRFSRRFLYDFHGGQFLFCIQVKYLDHEKYTCTPIIVQVEKFNKNRTLPWDTVRRRDTGIRSLRDW